MYKNTNDKSINSMLRTPSTLKVVQWSSCQIYIIIIIYFIYLIKLYLSLNSLVNYKITVVSRVSRRVLLLYSSNF